MRSNSLKPVLAKNYPSLVRRVREELSGLETFLRAKTIECYWNIGKYIQLHILENKERAGYGKFLFQRLAQDTGRNEDTLSRSVLFYKTYPSISALGRKLTWSHYRQLITVKDPDKRKQLEEQFQKKEFDSHRSQAFLNFKKSQSAPKDEPTSQLAFTRGRLSVYPVIEGTDSEDGILLDLGFRVRKTLARPPENTKPGDFLQLNPSKAAFSKVFASRAEIFTYKAEVLKVIDADTLLCKIELGFGLFIEQKFRLRGIDCPELGTDEGLAAKKFVQARLAACDFIVAKTFKDTFDKYDRYLTDVFYAKGEKDPLLVAEKGVYLNQELLDERLARVY